MVFSFVTPLVDFFLYFLYFLLFCVCDPFRGSHRVGGLFVCRLRTASPVFAFGYAVVFETLTCGYDCVALRAVSLRDVWLCRNYDGIAL